VKVPKKLKIGPYTYPVITGGDPRDARNGALWGRVNYAPPSIEVGATAKQAGESRVLATVLHESIHAIDEYMRIGLSEKQTTRLANGLAAFLLDNRLLRED
jgi:hypothetical protein